jgi:hypothetical protein
MGYYHEENEEDEEHEELSSLSRLAPQHRDPQRARFGPSGRRLDERMPA